MKRKSYNKKQKEIAITMMRKKYSITEIAFLRSIPRGTLYGWLQKERQGIPQVQKRGRKERYINPEFISLIINQWNAHPCGSFKMFYILKKHGYGVSQRQI